MRCVSTDQLLSLPLLPLLLSLLLLVLLMLPTRDGDTHEPLAWVGEWRWRALGRRARSRAARTEWWAREAGGSVLTHWGKEPARCSSAGVRSP